MNRGLILCNLFIIFWSMSHVGITNIYSNEISETKIISKTISRSTPIDLEIFRLEDKRKLQPISIYNQVLTCFGESFGDKHGRSTNVHETVHGINNALSNNKKGYRGFYAGNTRALWIKEPALKMSEIIPYIPNSLKGYRYKLYFISQLKYWESVALYPVDEWSAYISGAECSVDDYLAKEYSDTKTDSVSGALEFSIYCTALATAIKEKEYKYWSTYPQFKNSIKFFLVRSEKVFMEGREIFPSENQEKLLKTLRRDESAEKIRNFLIKEFDGVFINE